MKLLRLPTEYVTSACKKILKSTINLMSSDEIKSDVMLLNAYHKVFLNKYMAYLQGGDPINHNIPGFQSRLTGTTYYLMHRCIESLMDNKWKQNSEFQSFKLFKNSHLDEETKKIMDHKVSFTLSVTLTSLQKHFDFWLNETIIPNLFSEPLIAQVISCYLLDKTPPNVNFTSSLHQIEINTMDFYKLVSERCTMRDKIIQSRDYDLISKYMNDLSKANNLLTSNTSFRNYFMCNFFALSTNTHKAERSVKLSKHCNNRRRNEEVHSMLASSNFCTNNAICRASRGHNDPEKECNRICKSKKKSSVIMSLLDLSCTEEDNANILSIEDVLYSKKSWSFQQVDDAYRCFLTVFDSPLPRRKDYVATVPVVERTPIIRGRVLFGKLLKNRDQMTVIEELAARNVVITDLAYGNWRELVNLLKFHEKDADSFKPLLGME